MALYRRIFPHREKKGRWGFRSHRSHKKDYNFSSPEVLASYKNWQAPQFDQEQIRLLVFIECDLKGRRLLFDSKAIKKNEEKTETTPIKGHPCKFSRKFQGNTSNRNNPTDPRQQQESPGNNADIHSKYTFLRPSPDVKLLGEMMYGSVAMSYRGSTVKVHTIRSPPELMLSQVFVLRPKENLDQDSISLAPVELMVPQRTSTSPATQTIAHSLPVAVPPSSPYNSLDEESGVVSGSNNSFLTPFPSPGSSVSSTQSNSFHRRWMRNQVTSMEHGVRRKSSIETVTVEEPMNRRRHPKIGMGVVISLFQDTDPERNKHFQTFFFSHFTLFESHFHRLYLAVEKALTYQRRVFVLPIMEALEEFRSAVYSLYCAPRIQTPVWLNMMTYQMQRGHLCEHLMHEIMTVLELHDNKQTNFFFSRLMTGVLMHHLAWVPTVIPAEEAPSRAYLDKHSSTLLDTLAKSHPYNPLWAQLGDIFGAIGYPRKIAKTIIVGHRADVVCRLLFVLSYFIRCSEVHEIPEHREKIYMGCETSLELPEARTVQERMEKAERSDGDVLRRERLFCESMDSGVESSNERFCSTEEEVEGSRAVQRTIKEYVAPSSEEIVSSTESQTMDKLHSVENKTHRSSLKDIETSSVHVDSDSKSRHCESTSDKWHENSFLEEKLGDQTTLEVLERVSQKRLSRLLSSDHQSRSEPNLRNLYPDLGNIYSEEAVCSSQISIHISKPSPPDEVPSVQLKDVSVAVPKHEHVVPVGREPSIVSRGCPQPRTLIYPKMFDNVLLDPRKECVVPVRRSSQQTESAVTERTYSTSMTDKLDEASLRKSWPGHDRLPIFQFDNSTIDLTTQVPEPREANKTLLNASPSLYPVVGQRKESLDATPVPSADNTDTESLDRTPPVPRRNKRFPLTSPLARAHQEALRANEQQTQSYTSSDNANTDSKQQSAHEPFPDAPKTDATHDAETTNAPTTSLQQPTSLIDVSCDAKQALAFKRQRSHDVKSPVRNYWRSFSTDSAGSSGFSDPTLIDHEELPMAFSEPTSPEMDPGESYVDNFGRSLLGGYSQSYVSDMALHGVPDLDRKQVLADLVLASQHSVLDEDKAESVCIVADTNNWTVELLSGERASVANDKSLSSEIVPANCVLELLESIHNMCHLGVPSDFCLMHLEDQLQELYFKSTALGLYLDTNPRASPKDLATVMGFDPSDLPLLLSVLSTQIDASYEKAL